MGKQETVSEIQRDTIRMISALHDRMKVSEIRAADRHTALMDYISREAKLADMRHSEIVARLARLNGNAKGSTP